MRQFFWTNAIIGIFFFVVAGWLYLRAQTPSDVYITRPRLTQSMVDKVNDPAVLRKYILLLKENVELNAGAGERMEQLTLTLASTFAFSTFLLALSNVIFIRKLRKKLLPPNQ